MQKYDQKIFSSYLEPQEVILDVIHRHWYALLKNASKSIVFGMVTPIILFWIYSTPKVFVVSALWCIIGLLYLVYSFFDWYLDAIILTDQNLLDIEWNGFFNKLANRIGYVHIESVSYTIQGVIPTFFGFGDLHIATHNEGDKGLKIVSNVREMQQLILNKRDEFVASKSSTDSDALKKALKAFIREGGMIEDVPEKPKKENLEKKEIWITEKRKVN
jgi:uncharacterized membrane protein YdbT with pleckstrin-like domain